MICGIRAQRLLGVVLLCLSAVLGLGSGLQASAAGASSSAVTVTGTGDFAGLSVTVAKTRGLVNEVVPLTWHGAAPTRGNFTVDYLQIMQCWGDDTSGPQREQCQYGGLVGDGRGGSQVASRQVTYDITDPKETYTPRSKGELRYVPFHSVTGKTKESALSEFFDRNTTNEVPFGQTRADGTGFVPFEMQTGVEAPGLGCGQTQSDTATAGIGSPRSCWLVVVPRGTKEVDGSTRTDDSSNQLISSPLSQSNWDRRLVVPLHFTAVGQPCPIGKAERPLVGDENSVEAVSSYQPVLCSGSGPVYSLSQVPDALARRQIVGDAPGLSLTTLPVPRRQLPPGRRLLYAPLFATGLTFAYNIESQASFGAPDSIKARNGQRIQELNLTPRLVAKLLTQSYQLGAAKDRKGLDHNPLDLTRDREFLALNPQFAQLRFAGIADVTVPSGLSDAAGLVWQWLLSDRDARAFLGGQPDPYGAVVNPAYKGLAQQDGFPKADPVCQTFPAANNQPPLCTLDAHPYASDGHEAARGAARGDTLARSFYDATAQPPSYKKQAPQPSGSRAVIALTDAATANRFGLQTARLRNASGALVAPTSASMTAGTAAMTKSPDAPVLLANPAATAAAAYPLTQLTYAVASVNGLTPSAAKEYAQFLRYVVGPGQVVGASPGQLPLGYVPVSASLRGTALAVAAKVAAGPVAAENVGTAPAGSGPASGGGVAPVPSTVIGAASQQPGLPHALGLPPVATPRPVAAPAPLALAYSGSPAIEAVADAGIGRYAVVLCLVVGGLAALTGSGLRRITSRPRSGGPA
jgi:hypothetical protein